MKALIKKIALFTLLLSTNRLVNCMIKNTGTTTDITPEGQVRKSSRQAATGEFLANNLRLFDGTAGTNQCHLNALMIVLLAKDEAFKSALSKNQLDTQDERLNFLANNVLLSLTLIGKDNEETVTNRASKLKLGQISRKIKDLLRGGSFIQNAKKGLNESILQFFFDRIAPDLTDWLSSFPTINVGNIESPKLLQIIPKFLGIKSFLNFLKTLNNTDNPIWMILKCKTASGIKIIAITPDQQKFISVHNVELSGLEPVIVIEGKSDLNSEDFTAFLDTTTPEALQLAVAAEFNKCEQSNCLEFVANLAQGLNQWIEFAEKNGLIEPRASMPQISIFFIQHMFPDTFKHAI